MNPFRSLHDYEEFIYTLKQRFPSVQSTTLIIIQRGKRTAIVQGEITLDQGYRITVIELPLKSAYPLMKGRLLSRIAGMKYGIMETK